MSQVFRCYVEKKPGFDVDAQGVYQECKELLGIGGITGVRLFRRYDLEGLETETYQAARGTVLSEPQVDEIYDDMLPELRQPHSVLAIEPLPGQYDQRADSCAQCIQMMTGGARPVVRTANIYVLEGDLTAEELDAVRAYLLNPVDSRVAKQEKPDTLAVEAPEPAPVQKVEGFCKMKEGALRELRGEYRLAMDVADLRFLQQYFKEEEKRDPTVTELRVVDTYWSDHCRHTTFLTRIDALTTDDREVDQTYRGYLSLRQEVYGPDADETHPQCLMDIATIAAKVLKRRGLLPNLDASDEVNACSVKVQVNVDGAPEDWLLMFKNETHNHPTEIEPFGGAATCIGGAIRDPLSGRAYVYQAMRLSGSGDLRDPISETLEGKLPQRKIAAEAAAGYSSYGNQIGVATGIVNELYHRGYIAKHMELGAVLGAAPADHVVRLQPEPGDQILLLGGRTGRDGIGGATGSSKSHDKQSLDNMASEVQKGNAPEERKIQRLFRDPNVTRMIKRCNDFGAGGVSVAIGELADGLAINLDAVRKKYDGLDGTELAISESQERMAVVVAPADVEAFIAAAAQENLEAYVVAEVTETPRMVMHWRGEKILDLSRDFLATNGAAKHAKADIPYIERPIEGFHIPILRASAGGVHNASQRGLAERFDATIGAASVLVPFGGKYQRTPAQVMAATLPVAPGKSTDTCSVMAWGGNPRLMERDPYGGAFEAVIDSLCKLVAAGCDYSKAYLSFQEYFPRMTDDPKRWGKPAAALLGALKAQIGLRVAAIGGKDSMSGSFLTHDVPSTLISFAVGTMSAERTITPEFKEAGHTVYLFAPDRNMGTDGVREMWDRFLRYNEDGQVLAAYALGNGGLSEGLIKMSFGNRIGYAVNAETESDKFYGPEVGAILAECTGVIEGATAIGITTEDEMVRLPGDEAPIEELLALSERAMREAYPTTTADTGTVEKVTCEKRAPIVCKAKTAKPQAVIPVFPGTNCEYDTASACLKAGITPEILVIRNRTADDLAQSSAALAAALGKAQMLILPGGFSGGDEPDGAAKFICAFLRNPQLTDAVHHLLCKQDGLILGICNGFQALVKLGLLPYGEIRTADAQSPTLTYNTIGRHQSRYVTTRVASVQSPWMLRCEVGELHTIPVSHGEGRFVAPEAALTKLAEGGQIATQYTDFDGNPAMDIDVNPNGSMLAIEGIFSPDGRVFGKMGHTERYGPYVAKNIPGNKYQPIFEGGALYFK
ncbi:MAG: phosphoribosylformylglycinamidine synthase [Oscillospiraceae bacterium]|nr:phosphoribosylformylglycinamidine synthase [Oscillospiraceae bacterium]